MNEKELIAKRAAQELLHGHVVNLGIGLPTMVVSYLPQGINIIFQSENGILGMRDLRESESPDEEVLNAGGKPVALSLGASLFDSCTSFGIIRGGHVDVAILGALQIDEKGSLASHIVPGEMVSGMGGAMDLVVGARKVIIAMTHAAKDGTHKILSKITLPPTAINAVNTVITEMGVMEVGEDGLELKEYNPAFTLEQIQERTGAKLILSDKLKKMSVG